MIPVELQKKRDEMAEKYWIETPSDDEADQTLQYYHTGFNAACEILLPLIEEVYSLLNTADSELQLNGYFDGNMLIRFKSKIESILGPTQEQEK